MRYPSTKIESDEGLMVLKYAATLMLGFLMAAGPAVAEVEQCRFIRAKPDREACYERQAAALESRRKPLPASNTTTIETLQQMRQDDDAVYKSIRGICRGC